MKTLLFALLLVPFLAGQPPQTGPQKTPDDPMRELCFRPN